MHPRHYLLMPQAIILIFLVNFWSSATVTAFHCSKVVSSDRYLPSSSLIPKRRSSCPLFRRTTTITSLTTKSRDNDLATTSPNASSLLASQSPLVQKLGVLGICTFLGGGTLLTVQLLTLLEDVMPYGWYDFWRDATWPIGFGGIFLAAGIAHFTSKQAFVNIVPPFGAWGGLWKVPAPGAQKLRLTYGEYHTYWTGIAEIGGGLLLLGSYLTDNIPVEVPSFLLFLLTIAVTPANIYMFTHDAEMGGGIPPIPYPWGHLGRGVMQMIILAMLWKLSFP
jgi:uncharacterized membrane protein